MENTLISKRKKKTSFKRQVIQHDKLMSLVKLMVITTSGLYMSVLGPLLSGGKNQDSCVHACDIVVVERGRRDSLQLLERVGIIAHYSALIWYFGYGTDIFLGAHVVRDWSEYVDDGSIDPPTVNRLGSRCII
ncbi:hypothetical protein MAR_010622 [Mya arenaria]|uniref:Uncharacterized protein n=1 Tax=Mya arenaria TaxID=6604 RepID=A0ABY7E4D4_MYAAR|nr:hypothetical protein MAR_010622 [Mya arenaria]